MKLYRKIISIIVVVMLLASCVKNESFLTPYTVPPLYNYETTDSSARARVIMMQGMANYLATAINVPVTAAIVDSLWTNTGKPFTVAMVPDFLYADTTLNKMLTVDLEGATIDADSIKAFADSTVMLSQFNGRAAREGVSGIQTQSAPATVKYLVNERGVEQAAVWYHAMLGAMSMTDALGNLTTSGESSGLVFDLSYSYMGFPQVFDPGYNYAATPLKRDRPLSIAALFPGVKQHDLGARIYAAYRTAKTSTTAKDQRVSGMYGDTIRVLAEKTLALSAINSLDSAKQGGDIAARLHHLSRAYGLVWALKYRNGDVTALSENNYWLVRSLLGGNFYTLAQEASYNKINQVRSLLATAYGF